MFPYSLYECGWMRSTAEHPLQHPSLLPDSGFRADFQAAIAPDTGIVVIGGDFSFAGGFADGA
jgi:hypothetical protein